MLLVNLLIKSGASVESHRLNTIPRPMEVFMPTITKSHGLTNLHFMLLGLF